MLLLLHYVPDSFKSTMNIYTKKWTFILKSLKGHQIMIFALREVFVHAPFPPSLPPFLPFLYSLYLWFLIVA